jgi:hypothetical protein
LGSTVSDGTAIWTCKRPKHEITEVILALSSGDLDTNTPGGALSIGNTILGGTSNKVTLYMRVNNNVNVVSNNTSTPDFTIRFPALIESEIP